MNYSSRQLCANIFFRGTRIDQFFANIFFRGTRIKNKNVIHIANVYVLERIRTRGRGGGGVPVSSSPVPGLSPFIYVVTFFVYIS